MLTPQIMDAMQITAAAVNLAYFRHTHDHIDHETMLKAKEVEKYLDNERRAGIALRMAEEAKEVEAQAEVERVAKESAERYRGMKEATKAGGLMPGDLSDVELLEKCRESIRRRIEKENEEARAEHIERNEPKRSGAFGSWTDDEVFYFVSVELSKARARYPFWPNDIVAAAAIASEESGEVIKAVNEFYWSQGDSMLGDIRAEAIQAIAMWVRFLVETPPVDGGQLAWNRQQQQAGDGLLFTDPANDAAKSLEAARLAKRDFDAREKMGEILAQEKTIAEARQLERGRVQAQLEMLRDQISQSIDWLGM